MNHGPFLMNMLQNNNKIQFKFLREIVMLRIKLFLSVIVSLLLVSNLFAAENLKPFVLASIESGDVASVTEATKNKLTSAGFTIAGSYSPYADTTIIGVTNDALKQAAGETEFGVFAAAQRVTVTKGKDGKIQVAFTDPVYMSNAYQLKSDLASVKEQLVKALGQKQAYGSEEGLTAEDLRDYQYKWLMPYFDDRLALVEYSSYDAAVKAVSESLAKNTVGVSSVYRVDIPDKKVSLFGVYISEKSEDECAGDKYIMDSIDFKDIKSTGHLPYDIVVKGNKAYALRAEFRIAISFPDLSMMGSNSFASIMCAPNAIEQTLTLAAGGELEE